jgi:2-dehydropantoate 2-reductase
MAAALARAGHEVGVFARGSTLAALRAAGLRIVDAAGEQRVQVSAADDAASFGVQDFVVLALKAQVLPAVAGKLGPLVGPGTTLVAAMNGLPWWFSYGFAGPLRDRRIEAVDPQGVVSAALPPAQAIGCVVHLSASTDAPGVIRRGRGNRLIVGSPGSAHREAARQFGEALRTGGFEVTDTPPIRGEIWAKLWGNMNMNPISALTGSMTDRILDDPYTHALTLRMMEEASAIGARLGLEMAMSAAQRMALTRELGGFKTSMLQDAEAGRPLELGPILGVFPELGRQLGVPTPYCDTVFGLLRQRAGNSGLAP